MCQSAERGQEHTVRESKHSSRSFLYCSHQTCCRFVPESSLQTPFTLVKWLRGSPQLPWGQTVRVSEDGSSLLPLCVEAAFCPRPIRTLTLHTWPSAMAINISFSGKISAQPFCFSNRWKFSLCVAHVTWNFVRCSFLSVFCCMCHRCWCCGSYCLLFPVCMNVAWLHKIWTKESNISVYLTANVPLRHFLL